MIAKNNCRDKGQIIHFQNVDGRAYCNCSILPKKKIPWHDNGKVYGNTTKNPDLVNCKKCLHWGRHALHD